MMLCIDYSDNAEQVIDMIIGNMLDCGDATETATAMAFRKLAYLFLICDVLYNCGVRIANASYYRKGLERRLVEFFEHLGLMYKNISSRIRAEQFKYKVMTCFKAWHSCCVYPSDFLAQLQSTFLRYDRGYFSSLSMKDNEDDIDGKPIEDTREQHGVRSVSHEKLSYDSTEEDIDGKPLEEDMQERE
ncbi:hypothetical protein ACOME3_009629 [Neoechinorhynchus agilis]